MNATVSQSRLDPRVVAAFAFMLVFVCALLFPAAGTLRWPQAWVFVIVYIILAMGSRYLVARRQPDLAAERGRGMVATNVKPWDKLLAPLVSLGGSIALLVVAGLDHRFAWSPAVAPGVVVLGLGALVFGYAFSTWAMLENRFFSSVVRIQSERGHAVASGGPYRYVRHPGYVGGIITYLAIPLALGALWALVPALATTVLMVLRTALEDRTLRAELPGYADYAGHVRWRLLPGVW